MKTAEELQALKDIRIEDYTYDLPDGRIARFPLECREQSKLLHFRDGKITPCTIADVRRILPPDATLVLPPEAFDQLCRRAIEGLGSGDSGG